LRTFYCITLYLLAFLSNTNAQLTPTDSLQLAFYGAISDTARLATLLKDDPSIYFAQSDKLIELYHQGYAIAARLKDDNRSLKILQYIGDTYVYGKSDEGTAFQWYQKALQIGEKAHDDDAISVLYYALGIIHDHQGNRAKMYESFLKAVDYAQKTPYFYASNYTAIISNYIRDKRIDEAIALGKKGVEEAEKKGADRADKIMFFNILARALKQANNQQQVVQFYNLKIVALLDSIVTESYLNLNIDNLMVFSGVSYEVGRTDLVLQFATRILNFKGKDNLILECQANTHSLLATIYEEQKNYPLSIEHLKKNASLRKKLIENRMTQDAGIKVAKAESERDLLQKQRAVDRQEWVSLLGFSIALLTLLGGIIAYRFYRREQKRKQEFAAINATKDKLFSIIAHDLRAPIGTLKNYLELADFGLMSQADFATASQKLANNVNALFQTLDNLLHWSYSQLKGIKAKPTTINLFDVVSEELRFLEGIAYYKKIEIVNNIDKESIIFADLNQVGLAIRNIVSNSLKFTPSDGKIVLESQNTEGVAMTIKISDNGIGMSQDIQNQLFTIQGNTSRQGTASEKGQGLGMILVKDMVEANHGTLRVESVENQGTTISIQLPIMIK
jgi:signal transduction histidine kinase